MTNPLSVRWYVRWLTDGHITGPMSKEEAVHCAKGLDNVVPFSERMLEPKFVTSSEVKSLIGELKGIQNSFPAECRDCGGLSETDVDVLQEAIDTLILLSREKVVPEAV